MRKTTHKSIAIFVICSLLSIFAVPAMAWDWPCPDDCYSWDGYNCTLIGECGVADPCPDEVHYSCVSCECVCDADPYYTQNTVITPVSITSPNDGDVFCIGSNINVSCSTSTDSDIYHHCVDNVWTEEPVGDPVTHTWSGSGTFDPATGTSSTFTPSGSAGSKTITITASDSPKYNDTDVSDSISVIVVEVASVTEDKTLVCVGETVTFTAHAYPSGKPLSCIEWEKRYKEESTDTWGDWETASGGDPTAELNTATAGLYQYRARNGSDDSWKESSEVTVVAVDKIEISTDGGYEDVTGDTIVVLKGTKYTFKAVPKPSDASWPSGQPTWSGVESGTGETIEVTFDSAGTQTLTAKCCSDDPGKTVTIKVIIPEPDQIYFVDYSLGEEHDIYGVTDPVWKRVSNPDDPACYTKNKHVRIRAKFWASENLTYVTQVHVDGVAFTWCTFSEDTSVAFYSWPSESTFHNSDELLPDSIGIIEPILIWTYKVPSGTNQWIAMASSSGPHKIYRVLGTPVHPQAQPWKEVLEKACDWAGGESAVIPAVGDVVDNIFTSGYEYDNVAGAAQYYDATDGKFQLTTCLSEWGDPSKDINCWDTANMVAIFSNSLGCDLDTFYMARPGGPPPPAFLLNYIKPIGRSWTNDAFTAPGRQGFACHWVAWSNVHDACLQVDNDGDPTSSPHTGIQPVDMTFDAGTPGVPYDDYRGKLVDPVHELLVGGSPQPPAEVK